MNERSTGPLRGRRGFVLLAGGGLGIDPDAMLPDLNGRPMYLLDDREPIKLV